MEINVLRPMEDIVFIRLIDDIDLAKLAELYDELNVEVFEGAPNPIFMIYDVQRVQRFAVSVKDIQHASTDILDHDNLGAILVIGVSHPIMTFVAKTVLYLAQIRAYFVEDVLEAMDVVDILREHDIDGKWELPIVQ